MIRGELAQAVAEESREACVHVAEDRGRIIGVIAHLPVEDVEQDHISILAVEVDRRREAVNIDHVIPRQRWKELTGNAIGCSALSNTVASCFDCNYYKDNLLLVEAGMELLPIGTFNSTEEADRIRASFKTLKKRPNRDQHKWDMTARQHPAFAGHVGGSNRWDHGWLSYRIGEDGRYQQLLEEAKQAAENEHNLHEGFYPERTA